MGSICGESSDCIPSEDTVQGYTSPTTEPCSSRQTPQQTTLTQAPVYLTNFLENFHLPVSIRYESALLPLSMVLVQVVQRIHFPTMKPTNAIMKAIIICVMGDCCSACCNWIGITRSVFLSPPPVLRSRRVSSFS